MAAERLQGAVPAISLVSMTALITAIANDVDADYAFAQQVFGLGQDGGVLVAISTSGNSANVIRPAKVAKVRDMTVIALTGAVGNCGRLPMSVCVPAGRVDQVQNFTCLCTITSAPGWKKRSLAGRQRFCYPIDVGDHENRLVARAFPSPPAYVVFDFDGVFTDNKVYVDQNGTESVVCDRRDGLGVEMLRRAACRMMILSRPVTLLSPRSAKLKIDVEAGCDDKAAFLKTFLEAEIEPRVIYMGNDLNDVEAMAFVGYAAAPGDAHPVAKSAADVVFPKPEETGRKGPM